LLLIFILFHEEILFKSNKKHMISLKINLFDVSSFLYSDTFYKPTIVSCFQSNILIRSFLKSGIMKVFYSLLVFAFIEMFFPFSLNAQRFMASGGLNQDLDNGSNFVSCASPGSKAAIPFTVSGLNNLSPSFALASVDLSFDLSCGTNIKDIDIWIVAPDGKCMQIYDHINNPYSYDYSPASGISGIFNVSMRDGSCLNIPDVYYIDPVGGPTSVSEFYNGWALNTNKTGSGNYGVFKANATLDMSSHFNETNPNGTWRIYASENATYAPCISAASILFANPILSDQTAQGESCDNPIVWTGQPICATTAGKQPSAQSPGWSGTNTTTGLYTSINGVTCDWNKTNNNDTWIKFTSTAPGSICISISGLDFGAQSIVITDANQNGDNQPCTQGTKSTSNDPNWQVLSCPNISNIYKTVCKGPNCYTGTKANQQHCFIATQFNQVFYLVVDGVGGEETPFYIAGISGPLPAILGLEEADKSPAIRNIRNEAVMMNGSTLQTNIGNQKINQEIYIYDGFGRIIHQQKRLVSGITDFDLNHYLKMGFNIVQIHMEGTTAKHYTFRINKIR
jgi:hypothetical protein